MSTASSSAADIEEVGWPDPASPLIRTASTRSCWASSWRSTSLLVMVSLMGTSLWGGDGPPCGGLPGLGGEEVAAAARRAPAQLGDGLQLGLAHALTGKPEALAHFFEGAGLATVEPIAQAQDLALAGLEGREEVVHLGGEHGVEGGDVGRNRP